MPIPQVSVFLDNRPGSLSQVMTFLEQAKVRIFALSIADAGEYGLVRIITDNPEKSSKILEEADFNLAKSKKNTEATAILITDKTPISQITKILGENDVNIEYAYSSAVHMNGHFALVLRAREVEKVEQALKDNNVTILSLEDIKQHFE